MRRIVCSAVLFLLVAAPQLGAQNIDLRIKGGINVANVSTNILDFVDTQSKTGFGGNLDFMLSEVIILLDVRYQLGLTNLNDDEEFPEESIKTRTWQIMAGFGFPVGN